jgi:hypothetical protein
MIDNLHGIKVDFAKTLGEQEGARGPKALRRASG